MWREFLLLSTVFKETRTILPAKFPRALEEHDLGGQIIGLFVKEKPL
jgi:hypothetical protein